MGNNKQKIKKSNYEKDNNILGNNPDATEKPKIPEKLKVPKISRPNSADLDDKTIACRECVTTKVRNLEQHAKFLYSERNNLTSDLRFSLAKLKKLVYDRHIIICRADKDGKIIILNYADYDTIMKREFAPFAKLDIPNNDIEQHLKQITDYCKAILKELHGIGFIDDEQLYSTSGIKYRNGTYHHVQGLSAKYFCEYLPAYAYPLFKTHKLTTSDLNRCSILDIPVRLLYKPVVIFALLGLRHF